MLVAPKTVAPLYTIQNDFVRFDIGEGTAGFNWVGFSAGQLKDQDDTRLLFNVCDLWEVILVEPTREVFTERYKVVTPSFGTPVVTTDEDAERALVTIVWDDMLVDGKDSDPDLDRLKVTVELELRVAEKFMRGRIFVAWKRANPSTSPKPGRYAVWRVRFPIVDLTPAFANTFSADVDGELEDLLFVPEDHGVLARGASTAIADAHLGVWEPQDRENQLRNIVRPGSEWRQSHPGKASTPVMGYCGEVSGRGMVVGALDRLGRLKELCAAGTDDSIRMSMLHVPEWCYSLGNRPNGFTGAIEGDSNAGRDALPSHEPQAELNLPELTDDVPNSRDLEVDGQREISDTTATPGLLRLGVDQLGTEDEEGPNTLADLGYVSPFDVVFAPTKGFGPQGWNELARTWRDMASRADSSFPLQEIEDEDLPAAAAADALLDVDATVHDDQESLIGSDEANFPVAYPDLSGVIVDPQAVFDLVVPKEIVAERASINDIEVFGDENLVYQTSLLTQAGRPAGIQRSLRPDSERGYVRLFGKPNFYIAPEQVLHNDWYAGFQSIGRLRFQSLVPASAGIQVGDYIKVISNFGVTSEPYGGRATLPVATDSELYPNSQGDQFRIVVGFGASPDTLVVGRYEAGELVPYAFTPVYANSSPQMHFEVEVLREELNVKVVNPTVSGTTVRMSLLINSDIIATIFPAHAIAWAEVVEIDGVEYTFKRLFVAGGVAYVEFNGAGLALSTFNGKAARIRRRYAPIDLFIEGVEDGQHVVIDGLKLNDRVRTLSLDEPWATDEVKLSSGWLEFERPVVDETAPKVAATVSIYQGELASNRLLDASIDIEGGGFRFVDTGIEAAGGLGSLVVPGDLLLLTNASVEANQDPFEIAEVLSPTSVRVTRAFESEDDPGGGFTYRIVRPAKSFRDVNFGGRSSQDLVSGPRRLLTAGQDRVHFLAAGWLKDPTAPITGVFGVDSSSWADLGANPFIPRDGSLNFTSYKTSEWDTRKPDQEFPIIGYRDGIFTMSKAWAYESPNFSVIFDDLGSREFQTNAIQYRVVRDVRADPAYTQFARTKPSIDLWKTALEATAVIAVLRGWQPKIRGFDRPDFLPPRGKFKELLSALAAAGHIAFTALDLHGMDLDDEDGLSQIAMSYWNRFGDVAPPIGIGEFDRFAAPVIDFTRDFLLSNVLEELMDVGAKAFLMDGIEKAFRDDYGSPRFFRPGLTGDPTMFQISPQGGGPSYADGWRRIMDAAKTPFGVTQPADWIIGPSTFSSKDWAEIAREFPTSMLPFPVDGSYRGTLAGATLTDRTLLIDGVDFRLVSTTLYGEVVTPQPGDWVLLYPSGSIEEIEEVGVGLTFTEVPDLSGQDEWGLFLIRRAASNRIAAAPFFRYAFGEFATVAADVTFLASDISWHEVIQQRGTGISEESYQEAVIQAFGRSLYRVGAASVNGLLPSVRVTSEASMRVPPDRYQFSWTQNGTNTLVEQATTLFRESGKTYPLIQMHIGYLKYLGKWGRYLPEFFRYGPSDQSPDFAGATSLLVKEIALGTVGEHRRSVVAGAFRNEDGDILEVFTNWSCAPFVESKVEEIISTFNYAHHRVESGYWTTVELRLGQTGIWQSDLINVGDFPSAEVARTFSIRPLEMRVFLHYEQRIIVRTDAAAVEVDRVLIVPAGRSVAAALEVIAADVGSGSDRYVLVVGAGAIEDGLDVPSIPGATIEIQNSADENPTIGDIP
jgi:hypothetical protein